MQKVLKIDKNFKPCPADDGEEVYANGIFQLNISKMIAYIQGNPNLFVPETVVVKEVYLKSSHINEDHLPSVDVSKPVILAEIAPDQYNLIDGHHRVEKAVRSGLKEIKAYRLTTTQHIQFLTKQTSYEKYIEYWNDKLKQQVGTFAKDTLYQLHIVLMGWQDQHLHHFIKGDTFYAPKMDEDGGWGRMKCPPEDCGGVLGYKDMLEELNNLDGDERQLFLKDRFMDDEFDTDHFDIDEVNQHLKEWK